MTSGTFSSVNLGNGSLCTMIPILTHLPGLGPEAEVILVHNAAAVGRGVSVESPLGEGWTIQTLSTLEFETPDLASVTFGDGTRVFFEGGVGSPGSYASLDQVAPDRWRVTFQGLQECIYEPNEDGLRYRLVEMKDETGQALSVTYAATGLVSKITEANGRSISFHDANQDGLIESVVDDSDPTLGSFTLSYSAGRLSQITEVSGQTVKMGYYSDGRLDWIDDGFDDDGDGSPNRWNYDYDSDGRVVTIFDPAPQSTSTSISYSDTGQGQLVTVHTPSGTDRLLEFDPLGRLIRANYPLMGDSFYDYDDQNEMTVATNSEGHTWTYEYDGNGNMTKAIDPLGIFSEFTFNALGRLSTLGGTGGVSATLHYNDPNFPTLVTSVELPADGMGNPAAFTTISYYPPTSAHPGLMKDVVGPNGVTTTYTYNSMGIVENVESGAGFGRSVKAKNHYDPSGLFLQKVTFTPDLTTGDPAGFPALPGNHPAIVSAPSRTDTPTSNWIGQFKRLQATISSGVKPVGSQNPEASGTSIRQFTFDYLGRVLSGTRTDDQATVDQQLPAIQRAFSSIYYDEPAPGFPFGGHVENEPGGVTRSHAYDACGRPQSITSTDGLDVTYDYYPDGAIKSIVHGSGPNRSRLVYDYRANNSEERVRVEISPDGGVSWIEQRRLESSYDAKGLLAGFLEYHNGVLVAVTQYTYDARDQLIWEQRYGLHEYNRFYTYDQGGNRTNMFTLDSANQLVEQRTYTYDVSNPSLYLSKANRLVEEKILDAGGNVLTEKWYFYDNTFGNLRELVSKHSSEAWYYGTQLTYMNRVNSSFQSDLNRVIERKWLVDGSGDIINGTLTYLRARELRRDDLASRYLFMERDAQTLAPIASPDSRVWSDHSVGSGSVQADYAVDPTTGGVSELRSYVSAIGQTDGTNELWFAGDQVGNTRWWLTTTGGVYHDEVQTAFGERISSGVPYVSRYAGFCGGFGGESGLLPHGWVLLGARIYDPGSGRWLQRDPIGLGGGINEYEYVANAPTIAADPEGLQAPKLVLEPGRTYTFTNEYYPIKFTFTVPGWRFPMAPPKPPKDLGTLPGNSVPPGFPPLPKPTWPKGWKPPKLPPLPPLPGGPPAMGAAPPPKPEDPKWLQALKAMHKVNKTNKKGESHKDRGPRVRTRCFDSDTDVWVPGGTKNIGDMRVGDPILTWDTSENRLIESVVEGVERHDDHFLIVEFTVAGEPIWTVPGHWIWSGGSWHPLSLVERDRVVSTATGRTTTRTTSAPRIADGPVFNLRVRGADNYLVGEKGVIVRDH